MKKRVALITGGARGIGRGAAQALADDGWDIAICYRNSEKEAAETIVEVKKKGRRGFAARCDVSDPGLVQIFVKEVEKELGQIDALINCAGPYHRTDLLKESVAGWNEMFANNLHPVFHLSQLVSSGMIARNWGRIINFSMANADKHEAQTGITAHYIAKSAVLTLTRAFAKKLAPHGITVNAISPGFIDSGSAPPEEFESLIKNIPAGYVGSIDDVIPVIRFLISENSRYVTGSNIHLSGAWGI